MKIFLKASDITEEDGDVLICSTNAFLNLSGGVGGELLIHYGVALQEALHQQLDGRRGRYASTGEVFETNLDSMPYRAVLHAIVVDPFYHVEESIVVDVLQRCLQRADDLLAERVLLSALGTGFGDLTMEGFARCFASIDTLRFSHIRSIVICTPDSSDLKELSALIA